LAEIWSFHEADHYKENFVIRNSVFNFHS